MLKLKVIVAWALMVLAAAAGAYGLVAETVRDVQDAASEERLDHRVTELSLELSVRARQAVETVDDVARLGPLAAALTPPPTDAAAFGRAHTEVWSLLEGMNLRVGADLLWVTSADGRVLARQGDRSAYGDGVKGFPAVAAALEGRVSDRLQIVDNRVMILVSAPLVDPRAPRVVGTVVAGYDLGREWLKGLAQRSGLSWTLLIGGAVASSTLDPVWNEALTDAFSRSKSAGADALRELRLDEQIRLARVFRLGGGLADFDCGLVVSTPRADRWLTLGDPRVRFIGLGAALALLFGLLFAWGLSAGLRRRAERQAAILREIHRTGTQVGTVDPKQTIPEHRPFIDLLNAVLGEQNKKDRNGTARPTLLTTLDGMVAIEDDPPAQTGATGIVPRAVGEGGNGTTRATQTKTTPEMASASGPTADYPRAPTRPEVRTAPAGATKPRITRQDAAALPPVPEDDEVYFEQVYQEFLTLRETLGQPVNTVNREKFVQNLTANKARIQERTQARKVRFTVFEKDGKASVKAAPAEG